MQFKWENRLNDHAVKHSFNWDICGFSKPLLKNIEIIDIDIWNGKWIKKISQFVLFMDCFAIFEIVSLLNHSRIQQTDKFTHEIKTNLNVLPFSSKYIMSNGYTE